MTHTLGSEGLTAMAHASRLPSSITFTVRNRRSSYNVSVMKSMAHNSFSPAGATSGRGTRAGMRVRERAAGSAGRAQ